MRKFWLSIVVFLMAHTAHAAMVFNVYRTQDNGLGKKLGTIKAEQTQYGVLFTPHIKGLSPGLHGFHIHKYPKCGQQGKAAGGHLDPQNTSKHLGPYNPKGHLGDLPALYVNDQGVAKHRVLAPKLNLDDLKGHGLIIHKYGDNYSDEPKPLGGGGPRIACCLRHAN